MQYLFLLIIWDNLNWYSFSELSSCFVLSKKQHCYKTQWSFELSLNIKSKPYSQTKIHPVSKYKTWVNLWLTRDPRDPLHLLVYFVGSVFEQHTVTKLNTALWEIIFLLVFSDIFCLSYLWNLPSKTIGEKSHHKTYSSHSTQDHLHLCSLCFFLLRVVYELTRCRCQNYVKISNIFKKIQKQ